jgi:hypothetical protein
VHDLIGIAVRRGQEHREVDGRAGHDPGRVLLPLCGAVELGRVEHEPLDLHGVVRRVRDGDLDAAGSRVGAGLVHLDREAVGEAPCGFWGAARRPGSAGATRERRDHHEAGEGREGSRADGVTRGGHDVMVARVERAASRVRT